MSIISKVYIEGVYQGQTAGLSWNTNQIYTEDAPFGSGYYLPLAYTTSFTWRIDTYDTETGLTTTGDDWTFTTKNIPSTNVPDRPTTYDPDLVWGWDTDTSTYTWLSLQDIITAGGGRFGQHIVVIGHETIYYGAL